MDTNIILTGFSGTGKSTVGKEVARLLDWDFCDIDLQISNEVGKSVSKIFEEYGEPIFRAMEQRLIKEQCTRKLRVISTGGGAIVNKANRVAMLENGFVVCLDANMETIIARLAKEQPGRTAKRPLLSGSDNPDTVSELKESREKYYSMAHATIDTNHLSAKQTAKIVVKIWSEYCNS